MNKTFRGQIANDSKQTIRLSTNNGLTGYKMMKFELMPATPESTTEEATLQIFTDETSADAALGSGAIDFRNPQLLAAAFYSGSATATTNPEDLLVIFDSIIFNQDIYITCKSNANINYHISLEQIKLDQTQATVATLKDMRGRE